MTDETEEQAVSPSRSPQDRSGQFRELIGADLPSNLEFVRILGHGSMARVFLARNTSLKRLVAVKILFEKLAADPISRKRFVREAQAAARISHPCVTTVYSVGTLGNDIPFIEMEYIESKNLAEILRSHGRFDPLETCKLLTQLATALAAAHDSRIIHRDVKPANVLVEHDSGRVFLTDFGIAGILESGSEEVTRLTREGERLGDPTYMSPEQLRGEVLTPQSDIYSLGLLGYEMLTLHGPFGDADITDIAGAHIRRAPIELHEAYTDVPRDLGEILRRCVSKKPAHRPRAKELADLFDREHSPDGKTDLPSKNAFVSFLRELQKRRVYRTAVAYAAITFILLQVADLILAGLGAPTWVFRFCVVACLAGFPVAVVLAWIFDIRQGRLTRTEDVSGSIASRASPLQRVMWQVLGLLLSIAIAAAMAWWLLAPEK